MYNCVNIITIDKAQYYVYTKYKRNLRQMSVYTTWMLCGLYINNNNEQSIKITVEYVEKILRETLKENLKKIKIKC